MFACIVPGGLCLACGWEPPTEGTLLCLVCLGDWNRQRLQRGIEAVRRQEPETMETSLWPEERG